MSTLDVAGKGGFTLLTGIGGDGWRKAAEVVHSRLGVKVKVVGIGIGLEWEDVYLEWEEKVCVDEDGCVLVRPDLFVAWRSQSSENESERLLEVMRSIMGVSESKSVTPNKTCNGATNGTEGRHC